MRIIIVDIGHRMFIPTMSTRVASHRPWCNVTEFPTAALGSILCRVGGAALRTMVFAVHVDVDDPYVLVEAFHDISAHAQGFGPIRFVHQTVDVEGCARISPTRRCHELWRSWKTGCENVALMFVGPVCLQLRVQIHRSTMPPRAMDAW